MMIVVVVRVAIVVRVVVILATRNSSSCLCWRSSISWMPAYRRTVLVWPIKSAEDYSVLCDKLTRNLSTDIDRVVLETRHNANFFAERRCLAELPVWH